MGLSLRKIGNSIRDVFDANTASDQAKRVAQGRPAQYSGVNLASPASVVKSVAQRALPNTSFNNPGSVAFGVANKFTPMGLRDRFDSNTASDQLRRAQATQTPFRVPTSYEDQQAMQGNTRPFTNIGQHVIGNAARVVNTAKQQNLRTVPQAVAGVTLKVANRTGLLNNRDYNNAVNNVLSDKKVYGGYTDKGDILNAGTVIDSPEQAKNLTTRDVVQKSVGYGLGVYGELSPIGAKGGLVGRTLLGATEGAVGDVGSQMVNTGNVNLRQTAGSAVFGGTLSNVGPAISKLVNKGSVPTPKVSAKGKVDIYALKDTNKLLYQKLESNRLKGLSDNNPSQIRLRQTIQKNEADISRISQGGYIKNPLAKKNDSLKKIYHGTDKVFDEFDVEKSADGGVWFTDRKDLVEKGDVGASGKGQIMERFIDENDLKLANWDDVDKYTDDQLINMGYDGYKLSEDGENTYKIFDPKKTLKSDQASKNKLGLTPLNQGGYIKNPLAKDPLESLTPEQKARFDAGTPQEKQKALEYLSLKKDLEANDAIVGTKSPLANDAPPEIPSYVPKGREAEYLKSEDYLKDQRFNKMASETKSGDPFDHPDMYDNPTPDMYKNLKNPPAAPVAAPKPKVATNDAPQGKTRTYKTSVGDSISDLPTEVISTDGGYIRILKDSPYAPDNRTSIVKVMTDEGSRRQGVGSDLVQQAIDKHGNISAFAENEASQRMFYKKGLRPLDEPNASLERTLAIGKEQGGGVTMVNDIKSAPQVGKTADLGEVPPKPKVGLKDRRFKKNISKTLPDNMTAQTVAESIPGYKPITNKATLRKAADAITENPQAEFARVVTKEQLTSAQDVATGNLLLRQAIENGDVESAIQLGNKLGVDGTKLGQAIQAYATFKKTTPEGIITYASKKATKAGKELNADTARQLVEKAQAIADMPESFERAKAIRDLLAQAERAGMGWKEHLSNIYNSPRSAMATADLSAPLRQGAVLGSRFPKEFSKNFVESVKYFFKPDYYEREMYGITQRPNYNAMKSSKLAVKAADTLTGTEEDFVSNLLEGQTAKKLGFGYLVEASDRAYSGFLAKFRADVFDKITGDLSKNGVTLDDKTISSLSKFINSASGRGSGKYLDRHGDLLSQVLFSPKLWKSRIDTLNPAYYARLDPVARKYAMQSALTFAGTAASILGLAKMAGADVEDDPRSADFGKIKVGNTRYDILGGHQQNIRLASQLITGQKINSETGELQTLGPDRGFGKPSRLDIAAQFVQNKANPVVGFAAKALQGTDPTGEKINLANEFKNLYVPLNLQGAYETAKDQNSLVKGTAMNLPGTFGVGVQTYGDKKATAEAKPKDAVNPNELNTQSTARVAELKKNAVVGDNGLEQLPNGKYAATINGEVKTFTKQADARHAARMDHALADGSDYKVFGDRVYYRADDGSTKYMTKSAFDKKYATSGNKKAVSKSNGGSRGSGSAKAVNPLKYAVSTKSTAKGPTISLRTGGAGRRVTLKAPTGAPKVSIRKSKV